MQKKKQQPLPSRHGRVHRMKNHPLIVPVTTFLVLFVISLVAFVALGGKTIGPNDSHIVKLYVDGKQQTLPSRATTVGELLTRAHISVQEHDVVEPALDAQITDDNFNVNVYRAHPVTIVDSNSGKSNSVTTFTAQQAPAAIAKQAGLTVYPEDNVTLASADNIVHDGIISQQVVIQRAKPVNINLYGTPIVTRTQSTTVAKLLAEKNIKPQPTDTVTPALDTTITPDMQVFVVSVGKQILTVAEDIPAPVQTVDDPSVNAGSKVVTQAGVPGKKLTTYELQIENGKEVSRHAIQEVVSQQPVTQIVARGTKVVNNRVSGDKSAILAAGGVPASQYYAADFVISRESGWNLTSRNAGGCLGLGQACPGSKLINACPNWQTDAACQVSFFSGYANGRYGSWQGAYNFWVLNGWW